MRTFASSTLALGFGVVIQLAACSNSADDCAATGTCSGGAASGDAGKPNGASGDAGRGAGGTSTGGSQNGGTASDSGAGGGGPGTCKSDLSEDAACWTTNELGVFVSSNSGSDDTGSGTKEAPFASISKAIASAKGKNVYVCRGDADAYSEQIILGAAADGIGIYAGFDCADWSYSVSRTVDVKSPKPIALRIMDLKRGVVIENIRFYAADGTAEDVSSYGAFITASQKVVLRRVEISAGAGMKGADGNPGSKGENGSMASMPPPTGSDACAASAQPGEWLETLQCAAQGSTQGGLGGKGVKNTGNALPGGSGSPTEKVHPLSETNNGGAGEGTGDGNLNGKDGAAGDAGEVGAKGPTKGTFAVGGYVPAAGNAGKPGFPGQGGGGGGAAKGRADCFGASGGAGGMGGCGGTPGAAGQGGGASIGLFAWNSEVTLQASKISSSKGGAGGVGGSGGGGGAGADGGSGGAEDGVSLVAGGRGGKGGTGGPGGSGSGGTGGPSYALAYSGAKPAYADGDTMLIAGLGGDAGKGGAVASVMAPEGAKGDSGGEFEIK